jgi:hypothetical protein
VKKAPARKVAAKKAAAKPTAANKKSTTPKVAPKSAAKASPAKRVRAQEMDLDAFPSESLKKTKQGFCLACALDVLTRHLGLSADRARAEIRRHVPSIEELSSQTPARPYFSWPVDECPYCGAPSKWLTRLDIIRIEGGKATDTARRALLKNIEKSSDYALFEERSTERDALYSWLSNVGADLDLDSPEWLLEATRHWLGRRLPKDPWQEIFQHIRFVRRSRRLEDGFEVAGERLFLAPALFDEVLLIQYLLSRSHKAGGLTFEGRLTLNDLFHRLRGGGFLRKMGITTHAPSDALEQLVDMYGGESRVKFYYVLDRRDFLSRLTALKGSRIPRPRR